MNIKYVCVTIIQNLLQTVFCIVKNRGVRIGILIGVPIYIHYYVPTKRKLIL